MLPTAQPHRLKGRAERRGMRTGFSVRGAMLFGFAFVAAGIMIVLVGMRLIPVDPDSVHAPYWVLTAAGAIFASGGLLVWGMAATQDRDERRRREAMRRFGSSPALQDYGWDPRGHAPPRWKRAGQTVLGAMFFTLFLSVFNWWAWGAGGPWPVKAIVTLFDLILVAVWWQAVVQIGRAIRFGGSRVEYDHFPYLLNEAIALRWIPPQGIVQAERGSVTFRCVEEYYEERGSGSDRNRWLVHDELCAETQSFDTPRSFAAGRAVEFRFSLPSGARPTRIDADRPVYWELEVRLSMPGFDFEDRYLVPVYER